MDTHDRLSIPENLVNPWPGPQGIQISMGVHGCSLIPLGSQATPLGSQGTQISMNIHGYPWLSKETHGIPWYPLGSQVAQISIDFRESVASTPGIRGSPRIHGYPWIYMDVHGSRETRYPCISMYIPGSIQYRCVSIQLSIHYRYSIHIERL